MKVVLVAFPTGVVVDVCIVYTYVPTADARVPADGVTAEITAAVIERIARSMNPKKPSPLAEATPAGGHAMAFRVCVV